MSIVFRTPPPFKYDNVPVTLGDQATPPIDIYFHRDLNSVTLASDAVVDSFDITLVGGHGAQVGERIGFTYENRIYAGTVLVVNVNVITLDMPINYTIPSGTVGIRAVNNMAVNGSVTPVSFTIAPPPGIILDITRLNWVITGPGPTQPNDTFFGNITALTNGVVLRQNLDGERFNFINIKSNSDLIVYSGIDLRYNNNTGGGDVSTNARSTLAGQDKHGVVARLNGDVGMSLEIIIRDDLSSLTSFRVMGQGHYTDDVVYEIES